MTSPDQLPDENPYVSPSTPSDARDYPKTKSQSRPRRFIVATFCGAVVGSFLLATFARGPSDPSGHILGAIYGAFLGLMGMIVLRLTFIRG